MSLLNQDQISKLGDLQNPIWQTVSITASEAVGEAMTFGSPLAASVNVNDLFAEMASPKLVVSFAFDFAPESVNILLLGQETFCAMVAMVRKVDVAEVLEADDSMVSEVRPILESVVQGMCLSIGNIRNEPLVTTGVTVRYQVFSIPPNFGAGSDVCRVISMITSTVINGDIHWLMDEETALEILGERGGGKSQDLFPESAPGTTGGGGSLALADEVSGLQILMDIPLEISVELGRVKMPVKDVVDLGSGSIVEIDKAAGEPVDVLVNGRLVARGEVVVIEDNFGVRITEILSPAERLQRLNDAA